MGTISQKDFDDYKKESRLSSPKIDGRNSPTNDVPDEDENTRIEETSLDTDWLREVGFGFLIEMGKDDESDILDGVMKTLTRTQAETVCRRVQQVRAATLTRRGTTKARLPDVRDVFPTIQENISSDGAKHTPLRRQQSCGNSQEWASSETEEIRGRPVSICVSDSLDSKKSSAPISSARQISVDEVRSVYKSEPEQAPEEGKKKGNWIEKNLFSRASHKQGYKFANTQGGIPISGTGIEVLSYVARSSMKRFVTNKGHARRKLDKKVSIEIQQENIEFELNEDWSDQNFGFEVIQSPDLGNDELPEVVVRENPLGVNRPSDLSADDLRKMLSLALIELTSLFDDHELSHNRRKSTKRKLKDGVFGVPLSSLIEEDRQRFPGCKCPILFQKLLEEMESRCLKEEGILRKTGSVQVAENLKELIDNSNVGNSWKEIDEALAKASAHDLAYVAKSFIRELPQPLLTNAYVDFFLQVPAFPSVLEQLKALNLLVMLLPEIHRETLKRLLDFLERVSREESSNRMNGHSLSVIMAPNLFPIGRMQGKAFQELDVSTEMALATLSATVTKMLLKYKEILFQVPPCLLKQIREQNEEIAAHKANKHKKRQTKKVKDDILKPRSNSDSTVNEKNPEVERKSRNVLAVQIECDRWRVLTIPIEAGTSVTEFVQRALEAAGGCGHKRANGRSRISVHEDLQPTNQSSNQSDLVGHSLCEIGGNIGELRLDPDARIAAVAKNNPSAEWRIKCSIH